MIIKRLIKEHNPPEVIFYNVITQFSNTTEGEVGI